MTDHQALLDSLLKDWQPEFWGTLIFVREAKRVLLIEKKTGHGAGRINGPGGKIEPGETPVQCALRELQEETGVTAHAARLMATLRFVELAGSQWFGYAFVCENYSGKPTETLEAAPYWCPVHEIPLPRMWPDDAMWLPRVLAGEALAGDFLFRNEQLLAGQVKKIDASRLSSSAHESPRPLAGIQQ